MQQVDVFVQVLLVLHQNPFFEVGEVVFSEPIQPVVLDPSHVVLEVGVHLGSVKDTVDHMAAEEADLYLVFEVAVNALVLVDQFEHVRGGGTVRDFEVLEGVLDNGAGEFVGEVLDADLGLNWVELAVRVVELFEPRHVVRLDVVQHRGELFALRELLPVPQLELHHLLGDFLSVQGFDDVV